MVRLALIAAALALGARDSSAQEEHDPRWLPWLACWEPADSSAKAEAGNTLLCVIPVGVSAAEITKVSNGAIESRERIDPSGGPQAVERDGCQGRETAEWSPDGMRLYLTSVYTCEGVERRASGVMSTAWGGDWLDVRGLATADRRGVSVIRYREAFPSAGEIPEEISVALDGLEEPRRTAQEIAGGRLFATSVIEASQRLDAPVVEAWLVERGLGFTVRRAELLEMEAAGVPLTIIDLVVALSYPERFAVDRPTRTIERARPRVARGYDPDDHYYYPYRAGYGAYYGYGWYPGDGPVVVVSSARAPRERERHGKVVKDKGYQADESSSSSKGSTPDSGGSPRRTESSSSESSSDSKSSSSSSPSSSTERTAKPRP